MWDDGAVEALLDRGSGRRPLAAGAAEEEVPGGDTEERKDEAHWANEYLSTFKVAQYTTKARSR